MKQCGMEVSRGQIQFTCRLFNWKRRKNKNNNITIIDQ